MLRAANEQFRMKLTVITMVSLLLFGDVVIGEESMPNTTDSFVLQEVTPDEQQLQQQQQIISDVNLFDQLNTFIQSRGKNVSDISEHVYFKYYNR